MTTPLDGTDLETLWQCPVLDDSRWPKRSEARSALGWDRP